ncbi:hypothetical protein HPC62_10910 [Thermoleptolyngbya sichuanensis A183]|uniref:Uncharacterized protein n=1 Tax=Thermoleptolyngbya sichuanensis A183 TaxID=2737172 RepID=A0A6M8B2Z6_9CYAN|nr:MULTISPECIES: hypothetical protein [Thermoleptolyngbya]MDG2616575.1 hypothetical protein [Thermoleptolyngbya sichuanensis XZ-Cy5]QKD80758.1 hypothetical protein HPC62_10910 [Thermoleptolyngbya sichuanensis A183]
MEPGSRNDTSPETPLYRAAEIAGTFIAVLTLVVPVAAIAYFSTPIPPSSLPTRTIQAPTVTVPTVTESSIWNRHHPLQPK